MRNRILGIRWEKDHWEQEGKKIEPDKIQPLVYADTLRGYLGQVGNVIDLARKIIPQMDPNRLTRREEIIQAYGKLLQNSSKYCMPESDLPFPKDVIRHALASALVEKLDENMRNSVEVGFLELEHFLSPEEFEVVNSFFGLSVDKDIVAAMKKYRSGDLKIDEGERMRVMEKFNKVSPGVVSIMDKVSKRVKERYYQMRVLRSIASGEREIDMVKLIADAEEEGREAEERLRKRF